MKSKSLFSKMTVTKRMIIPLTLCILIVMGGSIIYSFVYLSQSYVNSIRKDALTKAMFAADEIDKTTIGVSSAVDIMAESVRMLDKTENQTMHDLITYALKVNPDIFGSTFAFNPDAGFGKRSPYVYRLQHNVFDASDLVDSYDYEEESWYTQPVRARRPTWSEPYFDDGGGNVLMVTYSVPVFYEDTRQLLGVMTGDIELEWLKNYTKNVDEQLFAFIIDMATGMYITHPNENFVMNHKIIDFASENEMPELEIIGRSMIAGQSGFEEYFNEIDGKESFIAYSPVSNANWAIAIVLDKEMMLQDVNYLRLTQIIIMTVGSILFILLIVTIARSIKNQLGVEPGELIERLKRLAMGEIIKSDDTEKYDRDSVAAYIDSAVESMDSKTAFADAIGKGNFSWEFSTAGDRDVLGNALLEMRDNLQVARKETEIQQEEERRRNWATGGLAKMGELLRLNNDNLEELSNIVISEMVKYLGANQGGLFVLNDSDEHNKYLELTACYAYDRKKFAEKQIAIDEGLTGACFLEGQSIYMVDIPSDYMEITSGLGGNVPKALLIAPLKLNEQIYGVIELASFKPFEQYQIEFVEKVSESIASTLSSVKTSLITKTLLDRSKLQAEEMANQEEELRQTMEEMQATQDETRRRERELNDTLENLKKMKEEDKEKDFEMQQFHNAIFESCNVVEFSSEGVITDVNDNILTLFNAADKSVFVGKHISSFISKEAYQTAWASIAGGNHYEDVQHVNVGEGKIFNIRQKFMPICNIHGRLLRVMLLAFTENE